MIDGLKVQMTTDELSEKLADRIDWHRQSALEYARELRHPARERSDPHVHDDMIVHEIQDHQEQIALLTLLRDHLVPDETYLLAEHDLRFADLAVSFRMTYQMPRRLAADVSNKEWG